MGLESVELVMAWEEHFEINIPNEVATRMETPRQTIAEIDSLLKAKPSLRLWKLQEIERDVCALIVEQIGNQAE